MTHLPECPLVLRCRSLTGPGRMHEAQMGYCSRCKRGCFCDSLTAVYQQGQRDEREKRTRYLLADDEGTWAQGYREGLVEGLQQRPTCQYDYDRGVAKGQRDEQAKRYEAQSENWEKGYAAALDAAEAAVAELTEKGDSVRPADVMVAIEALGGER